MLLARTLDFKGQCCHGGKHSKRRVTALLCTNMDGSNKRSALVAGKSAKPRCFNGNWRRPVKYVANVRRGWLRPFSVNGSWLLTAKWNGKAVRLFCCWVTARHTSMTSNIRTWTWNTFLHLSVIHSALGAVCLLGETDTATLTKCRVWRHKSWSVALQMITAAWSPRSPTVKSTRGLN